MRSLSLAYHDVIEVGTKGLPPDVLRYCLDRPDFLRHLEAVRQDLRTSVDSVLQSRSWGQRVPVFLTFDDGGTGAYTCVADALERYGWRGHFFIATDWIGRPGCMNARQIRSLHTRGHVIGSHSCSHPGRMSRLSWRDLLKEWRESCARLQDIVGDWVRVASVPDGYYSQKVGLSAACSGIEALFTSEPTAAVKKIRGCLVLGRYMILRGMPPSVSAAIAAGHRWPRWRQAAAWQMKKAVKMIAGQHYLAIRQLLLERGVARSVSQWP